ncbi:DUF6397 family protein [Streptomyces sp. NBC_00525]|nr:DUF6397 family protein [Streptomyces sp. NBC_00525]WUC97865.1 DUF6397 family protein [Streptomyces sp. NBC_00525]
MNTSGTTESATAPEGVEDTISASRASAELGLKRAEFDLAVHLGAVRVVSGPDGRPRVRPSQIEHLRAREGFPDALREQVRTVGTAEGARLLDISQTRFTRLARSGCLTPIAFYLNRYRVVVWIYLAQEVQTLALRSPELLVGNSPPWMRDLLDAGDDLRPRNWRSRRIERLLALTDDPWVRAAVVAQGLDPVQLAEVVDDPYERALLGKLRHEAVFGRRPSVAGREVMARLMPADAPDEILWRRITLIAELDAARERHPAPRPGDAPRPQPAAPEPAAPQPAVPVASSVAPPVGSSRPGRPVGLLARLGRRASGRLRLRQGRRGGAIAAVRPAGRRDGRRDGAGRTG